MSGIITEATLITLLGGFISVITILLKYRLDNNKSLKTIEEFTQEIKRHDLEQDQKLNDLDKKLDYVNGNFERLL